MKISKWLGITAATAGLAMTMLVAAPLPAANAAKGACDPSFIGVPGSGQNEGAAKEMMAVRDQLRKEAAADGRSVPFERILNYEPSPFWQYAAPTAWHWDNLNVSEIRGQALLMNTIAEATRAATARGCPKAPILLAGYSQGAEVVSRAVSLYDRATRDRITVTLFGDPSFKHEQTGSSDYNSSPYAGGVRPYAGLGRYVMPSDVLKRTRSICAGSDPICATKVALKRQTLAVVVGALATSQSPHYKYANTRTGKWSYTHIGANYLWTHRASATAVNTTPAPVAGATGVIIISPCLNIRAGASGSTALLGCIPVNVTISIQCTATGTSVNGRYGATRVWDRTTWNGITGFVSDGWVYTGTNKAAAPACGSSTPPPPPPVTPPTTTYRVLASPCLNFRSGPSGSTSLIGCIPVNTMVPVLCVAQGNSVSGPYGASTLWDRTTWNGMTGYVSDAWIYTGTPGAVAGPC